MTLKSELNYRFSGSKSLTRGPSGIKEALQEPYGEKQFFTPKAHTQNFNANLAAMRNHYCPLEGGFFPSGLQYTGVHYRPALCSTQLIESQ